MPDSAFSGCAPDSRIRRFSGRTITFSVNGAPVFASPIALIVELSGPRYVDESAPADALTGKTFDSPKNSAANTLTGRT